jgi:hypothetical protein
MTCGIYLISFESINSVYIGKSIDIENRLKQHELAFKSGTHTKLLQNAYNLSNDYTTKILIESDYLWLDLLEAYYYTKFKSSGKYTLLNLVPLYPKASTKKLTGWLKSGALNVQKSPIDILLELKVLPNTRSGKHRKYPIVRESPIDLRP